MFMFLFYTSLQKCYKIEGNAMDRWHCSKHVFLLFESPWKREGAGKNWGWVEWRRARVFRGARVGRSRRARKKGKKYRASLSLPSRAGLRTRRFLLQRLRAGYHFLERALVCILEKWTWFLLTFVLVCFVFTDARARASRIKYFNFGAISDLFCGL